MWYLEEVKYNIIKQYIHKEDGKIHILLNISRKLYLQEVIYKDIDKNKYFTKEQNEYIHQKYCVRLSE